MNTRLASLAFRLTFGLIFSFSAAIYLPCRAQLNLPQASPLSQVRQVVGLTDISVTYHAPGVKGRAIWGKLVPYGQVWRSGANQSTRIQFSDDVTIGSQHIPAGEYAFYTLPTDSVTCYVILNRDTARWGTEGYDAQADVFRIRVAMTGCEFTETLRYGFSNVRPTSAFLDLSWERKRISVPIEVEVIRHAVANIRKAAATARPDDWLILTQGAEYLVKNDTEPELALELLDRSIKIKQNYYNTWVKARLLAQKDEYSTAIQLTKKAMQLGQQTNTTQEEVSPYPTLAPDMKLAMAQWKIRQ